VALCKDIFYVLYLSVEKQEGYTEIPRGDTEADRSLSKITKSFIVLQESSDPRVLQVESDEIVANAPKNGVPVEYVISPDKGHGFVKKENNIKASEEILKFLDKYLKGEPNNQLNNRTIEQ
jgi:dienelactone hydrolase